MPLNYATTLRGYDQIEKDVRDYLIEQISELETENCVRADLDKLLYNMIERSYPVGVYLDYAGATRRKPSEKFNGRVWVWEIMGIMLIRYVDEEIDDMPGIEANLRTMVDKIAALFIANHTIDKKVLKAEVIDISMPEPGKVNDINHYWIPFAIHVWDRV